MAQNKETRKTENCIDCFSPCYPSKTLKCRACFLASPRPKEWREAISKGKIGHKHSEDTKRKIGSRSCNRSEETLEKISQSLLGRKISEDVRDKIKKNNARYWLGKNRPDMSGAKNNNWQGGKTSENDKIRRSVEYKQWRIKVFERDNFTCLWCGDNRGGNLQADHIKPFAHFPELRFELSNGRTLCKECHKKTDTYLEKTRYRLYEKT